MNKLDLLKRKDLKAAPSGDVYIPYTEYDFMTNSELIDLNVNNIEWLHSHGGSGGSSLSSKVTDDSNELPLEGINPWKTTLNEITSGTYDFPSLTLNGETITEWPSGGLNQTTGQYVDNNTYNLTHISGIEEEVQSTTFTEIIAADTEMITFIPPTDITFLKRGLSYGTISVTLTDFTTDSEYNDISIELISPNVSTTGNILINFTEVGTNSVELISAEEVNNVFNITGIRIHNSGSNNSATISNITINLNFIQGILIPQTGCSSLAGDCYSKEQTDSLLATKANQSDLNNTNTEVESKANQSDLDSINSEVDGLSLLVETNTSSIDTLNSLVTQSFNTFGSYSSLSGTATNQTIRPTLEEIIPLDPSYVEVTTDAPNNFLNHNDGKVVFTMNFSNLTNLDVGISNLKINIYLNDSLILSPSADIPVAWSGSRTITGALEVEEESNVYFEFEVTGSLSVDAPIQYNIEFNNTSLVASPSSSVINDKVTNPTLGINLDLNKVDSNAAAISDIYNQIESLKLPIGSIIITSNAPTYGSWTLIGTLAEGQSIIGGSSTDGNVISHNHRTFWSYNTLNKGQNSDAMLQNLGVFDINGFITSVGRTSDGYVEKDFYTSLNGSDKNYAYGLGIGSGMNVYRRES